MSRVNVSDEVRQIIQEKTAWSQLADGQRACRMEPMERGKYLQVNKVLT